MRLLVQAGPDIKQNLMSKINNAEKERERERLRLKNLNNYRMEGNFRDYIIQFSFYR
jgi:hypothetical protein